MVDSNSESGNGRIRFSVKQWQSPARVCIIDHVITFRELAISNVAGWLSVSFCRKITGTYSNVSLALLMHLSFWMPFSSRCLSLFWIGASPSKCLPLLGRCILVGRFLSLDCSTRPQDSHLPFGNAEKTIEKSRREFSNRATSTAYLRIHNCQLRSNEFQVI